MPSDLTNGEMKRIYMILKALGEDQLGCPAEEWELNQFERLIDKIGTGQILGKLKALPKRYVKEVDKKCF